MYQLLVTFSDTLSIQHSDKETLKSLQAANGQALGDLIALNIGQIGENIVFSRAVTMTAAGPDYSLCGLTHPSSAGVVASDRVQVPIPLEHLAVQINYSISNEWLMAFRAGFTQPPNQLFQISGLIALFHKLRS